MNKIFIITAGAVTKNLSFGHFFRSFELAKYLKKKYKVFFLLTYRNKNVEKFLKSQNEKFRFIDKKNLNNFLKKKNFKYLIIDLPDPNIKLNIDNKKFIVFDEFSKYRGNCYYFLTSNIFYKIKKKYFNVYQNISLRLFKYLNKKIKIRKKIKKIRNILIFTGGSDIKNIKYKLLKKINKEKLIDYNFYFIKSFSIKNKIFTVRKNIHLIDHNTAFDNINKFDLAITNGGNSLFELTFLKIPCLCFPTNIIEKKNIEYLTKKKIVLKYSTTQSLKFQIKSFDKILRNFNFNYKKVYAEKNNLQIFLDKIF